MKPALARALHSDPAMFTRLELLPLIACVTLSSIASAETLSFMLPGSVSVAERREVLLEKADLRVSAGRLDAAHGIRREGDTEFQPAAVLQLGGTYVVRDATGAEHRLKVRTHIEGQLWIELGPVEAPTESSRIAAAGRFRAASMEINGNELPANYPELVLRDDGTFQLGAAKGHWKRGRQAVALDGHYAEWGVADVGEAGKTLTFDFKRGSGNVRVVMKRVEPVDAAQVVSAR